MTDYGFFILSSHPYAILNCSIIIDINVVDNCLTWYQPSATSQTTIIVIADGLYTWVMIWTQWKLSGLYIINLYQIVRVFTGRLLDVILCWRVYEKVCWSLRELAETAAAMFGITLY